jgi:hypothetical protein
MGGLSRRPFMEPTGRAKLCKIRSTPYHGTWSYLSESNRPRNFAHNESGLCDVSLHVVVKMLNGFRRDQTSRGPAQPLTSDHCASAQVRGLPGELAHAFHTSHHEVSELALSDVSSCNIRRRYAYEGSLRGSPIIDKCSRQA